MKRYGPSLYQIHVAQRARSICRSTRNVITVRPPTSHGASAHYDDLGTPMSWFKRYVKSSVGAKHIMAITGLILAGFVLVHMLGNLQLFLGQDALNTYALALKANFPLLWGVRAVLLVA